MNALAGGIPGRKTMPDIRPDSMEYSTFCHLSCKITKTFGDMQKKL
jgi:hypothetical protein